MKLNYFTFTLLFFLLILAVNATYIDEVSTDNLKNIKYFDKDTSVTLDGFNFTVPKGFGLIENESVNNVDGNFTESQRFFVNKDNEVIMISTMTILRHDLILSDYTPCDVNMSKCSIKGHEGIEWPMDNQSYFIYFDANYMIALGAPDSSYFEDIIS